jgi:hypothetical protein
MLRLGSILLLVFVCLGAATPAKAQWFENFCQRFKRDYHRNKMWPEPFLQADRQATMAPFAIQTANGWRRQNLLSDYHFQDNSQQLTLAGESKLRYILTQMPQSRRTVFVQQGLSNDITDARMRAVHRASSQVVPDGMVANVVESNLPNDGWPAEDIDAVTRKFNSSRPDPRLPASTLTSGSDTTSAP